MIVLTSVVRVRHTGANFIRQVRKLLVEMKE